MNEIKVIEGGVTAAQGFKAAGAYAGIRTPFRYSSDGMSTTIKV